MSRYASMADLIRSIGPDTKIVGYDPEPPKAQGAPTKRAGVPEHEIQAEVIAEVQRLAAQYPQLHNLFSVPNGGYRPKNTGRRLKAEGIKRGVPDLFLAWPAGVHHGLFIEMKAPGEYPRPDQREWHDRLTAAGYMVAVCRSVEETIGVLLTYLTK